MAKKLFSSKQAVLGLLLISVVAATALLAPLLAPNDPYAIDPMLKYQPPGREFPLGTDQLGRCVLSRLVYGARLSLGICVPTLAALGIVGLLAGTLAACAGGWFDRAFAVVCNIFMAFPPLILVMSLTGTLGDGIGNVLTAVLISMWAWFARVVRTYAAAEKAKPYILSCRIGGCTEARIMFRHIIPNILPQYAVYLTLGVASLVLLVSGFSFLGLGIPSGTPEWGAMLGEAKSSIYSHPMLIVWPGLCILLTAAGFNLFGEALRDAVSPGEAAL